MKVTKSFVDITEALGAEKRVTISTLTPQLHKILIIYLKEVSTDEAIKEAMYQNLSKQYHGTQRIILNEPLCRIQQWRRKQEKVGGLKLESELLN